MFDFGRKSRGYAMRPASAKQAVRVQAGSPGDAPDEGYSDQAAQLCLDVLDIRGEYQSRDLTYFHVLLCVYK